jgi:hypothetical protein
MSLSEIGPTDTSDATAVAAMVREFVEGALTRNGTVEIDVLDLRTLVSSVTRLYAACSERAGAELPAIDATVSATDAVTLACAVLRAHGLNPFDLALWFSRAGVSGPAGAEADDLRRAGS